MGYHFLHGLEKIMSNAFWLVQNDCLRHLKYNLLYISGKVMTKDHTAKHNHRIFYMEN